MRLNELVRGRAQRPAPPSQKGNEGSPRLSQLLRGQGQPAPPEVDPTPPHGSAAEAPGGFPEQAPDSLSAPSQAPETVQSEDLDAAKELFQRAVAIMEEIFQSVQASASLSIAKVDEAVAVLQQNLEISDALLAPFFSVGDRPLTLTQEMVNVCILSEKIGMQLNYSPNELYELGLAALLHDIGMARIPTALREKPDPLSHAEQAALMRCPEEGAQLIRGLGGRYAQVADVVLQVHERMDGSGYPRGLKGEKIHHHAQIVGLADVYESLVHHRPFRQRFWPHQAIAEILQRERASFPDRILKALIREVAVFPLGSLVRLDTGELGRVVAKNRDLPLRPVVAILVRRGRRLSKPELIDLSHTALVQVQEFVSEGLLEREAQEVEP